MKRKYKRKKNSINKNASYEKFTDLLLKAY